MDLIPLVATDATVTSPHPRSAIGSLPGARSWSLVAPGRLALFAIAAVAVARSAASGELGDAHVGVPVIAMVAIVVSVARWMPAEDLEVVRPVPAALVLCALVASVQLWLIAATQPHRVDVLFGPLVTATLVAVYLACWGFRSLFLLRRVVVLSILTWEPVATGVHRVVRNSVQQLSDLVYRRLAAIGWLGVDDEPWRWFTAMTHRGAIVVIGTVVLGVAASRRRLSMRSCGEVAAAAFLAMIVHHAVVLASPLDDYGRSWVARACAGPAMELVIAGAAAVALAVARSRREATMAERQTSPLSDRDPVIFGVDGAGAPALLLRTITAAVSVLLVATVVAFR